MRSLALLVMVFVVLCAALAFPFAGVLLWTWFSLQAPHKEAYGFVLSAPINFTIALVTLAALLLSRERKTPHMDIIFVTIAAFLAWTTFNGFFAFDPSWSWPYWNRTWKIFALGLVIAITATNRVRIHALIWMAVVSLFYFGLKGGLFTLFTGGHYHVLGPPDTIIADNNQLAVALLMNLPLAYYLHSQSASKLVARVLLAGIVLSVIAVLGSYSRGAFIGLVVLSMATFLRMQNRIRYVAGAGILAMFAFAFMPGQFFQRMQTIVAAGQDASFQGRLEGWRVAWMYAWDHFPFGAGFYGPQIPLLYHIYFPEAERVHAAHSIYFQVLGEQGFIGLGLYLILLLAAFLRCSRIISATREVPGQRWIADLATAIQTSLLVFCVSAAALSMAYYDLFVICVSLLLPLKQITGQGAVSNGRLTRDFAKSSLGIPYWERRPSA